MTGITIYIEGGGDTTDQKSQLRQGMDVFLGAWKAKVRQEKWRWKLIPCGGRRETYEAFIQARRQQREEEIILMLVDSEAPVTAVTKADHLRNRPGDQTWDMSGVPEEDIHLMVQTMEAWLAADSDRLAEWYGAIDFRKGSLPQRPNLEEEPKRELEQKLNDATRHTCKGEYHKIRHASQLLKVVRSEFVRRRCRHAGIFFDRLDELTAR